MGYNYYLLILGTKDGQVEELDYISSSGSYGSCFNHYFYERQHRPYSYKGDKAMGKYQYVHSFDILKMMYEKYGLKNPEIIKKTLCELMKGELDLETLVQIRDYVNTQLDTGSLSEGAFNELET